MAYALRRPLAALVLASTLAAAPTVLTPHAWAQASAITGNQVTSAVVETVDSGNGNVLLRDHTGGLVTVNVPKGAHNLPHLQPGDQINLRFFQTIDAEIVPPDAPAPESTVSSAKGYVHRHPHGTLISFRRQRVHVLAIDVPHHTVTFTDPDDMTRTVAIHQKPMQDFLATLKVGDDVDVTTMDAVSFDVTNRTVNPNVTVSEKSGQNASAPPASPAAQH
ncbi:hypothetical protein AA101099_1336 [Neoasaia chiangmaiensis NBRC 101099]|uniref:Uncharacterized protein n=1 Tax=Neoasaia chiangmaiensis TaxID=320497 RepID=A0A1U9KQR3_9PROT|nr:preprotein translocase subunit YajC [Neoasaia chiangmaiensis]AQS88070.1 hypothetical protein A0U93_09060 [Neoasaia chiangmaiensis]GBR38749.1 hypothetical protein AA101099_1336 [Neoasaia chiangmaiensis NBRC 101099]GEN15748.1 hypothetical protein NCH01_21790 [Neoasaia chiangmaiensis]